MTIIEGLTARLEAGPLQNKSENEPVRILWNSCPSRSFREHLRVGFEITRYERCAWKVALAVYTVGAELDLALGIGVGT